MTTYANSYRPTSRGAEGDTLATIQATAKEFASGTITAAEAVETMRADGAYEAEILTALNWE